MNHYGIKGYKNIIINVSNTKLHNLKRSIEQILRNRLHKSRAKKSGPVHFSQLIPRQATRKTAEKQKPLVLFIAHLQRLQHPHPVDAVRDKRFNNHPLSHERCNYALLHPQALDTASTLLATALRSTAFQQ